MKASELRSYAISKVTPLVELLGLVYPGESLNPAILQ
jgi:hypothetical protein